MSPTNKYKIALAVASVLVIVIMVVLPARAAPPANDDIYNATSITSLPFSEGIDTSEATTSFDDPYPSCENPGILEATVWYQFISPDTLSVIASTDGSTYNTTIGVYTGSLGALVEIACSNFSHPVSFQAESGNTYYIMVADMGVFPYPPGPNGGWLNFSLSTAPPPVAYFDYWSAPYYGLRAYYFSNQSYDPVCSECGLSASWDFGDGNTSSDSSPTHQFPADGSYIVSLTVTSNAGLSATIQRQVDVQTPPPSAGFDPYPYDPSIYDYVYFYNSSFDPACNYCGMTAQWDFGDGTASSDWSPSHQ